MTTLPNHFLNDMIDTMERYPSAIAWTHKDDQLEYHQLEALLSYYCREFYNRGIRPHQRVLILCDQPLSQIVLFYALSLLGAVVVLHAPIKNLSDWQFIDNDVKAHHSFSQFNTLTQRWGHHLYHRDHSQSIMNEVSICASKRLAKPLEHWRCRRIISTDCAMIVYTSGSTNRPKGIMLSHRNIQAAKQSITQYLSLNRHDKVCSALPFWFDYGLYQSILCFSIGAHLIQVNNLIYGQQLLNVCRQYRVSVLPMTPHFIHLISKYGAPTQTISSIKTITSTGSPLWRNHIQQLSNWFPRANVFAMYGLTECKRAMYLPPHRLHHRRYRDRLPLGIPIPNTRIQLVNAQQQPVDTEDLGEITIQGEHMMLGYWNRTEQPFFMCPISQQRYLKTGDLAFRDQWGDIYYVGRKDEMFKCKGERISPKSIEQHLLTYNAIDECVVFPHEHPNGETTIVAAYTGDRQHIDPIKLACRQQLPASQQPGQWIHLHQMPMLPSGKIDRKLVAQTPISQAMVAVV